MGTLDIVTVPEVEQFLALVGQAFERRSLIKLTLGDARTPDATLRNVYVRRVELRAGERFSFCYRHRTRDLTRNLEAQPALAEIAQLLGRDFAGAHLFTTEQEAELRCPAAREPHLRIRQVPRAAPASAGHDRPKSRLVEATVPWLHALGVTTAEGKVRAEMAAKFRQIHRFIEILSHGLLSTDLTPERRRDEASAAEQHTEAKAAATRGTPEPGVTGAVVRLVDMGCGKGYLTFAAHDWLGRNGWTPEVLGIEARAELVEGDNRVASSLGLTGLLFRQGTIAETALEQADILVALHACDTASDDALAWGIAAGARLILVAPCCHRELRPQLRAPPGLGGAFRHGIFRERQAEFVTDALRAALLEWADYQTRVFEFVAVEHTAKNVMIAATRRTKTVGGDKAAAAVRALAGAYGVGQQHLARRLGFELAALAADG